MKLISSFFILIFILISATNLAQEPDITPYLKKIEAGERNEVVEKLPELKRLNPNSTSLIYLEGLVTEDGEKAFQIYKSLVERFPKSKYADAALYRIYCYLIVIEKTELADNYLIRLKKDFPESPYIKLTEKTAFTLTPVENIKEDSKQIQPTKVKDEKFAIQAGAFTSRENAVKLKNDFEKAGYSSHIIQKTVGGTLFHVVHVGRFASESEAKSFLKLINSKFKLQGWVVELD